MSRRGARALLLAALLLGPAAAPAEAAVDALVRYHLASDANTPKFRYQNNTALSTAQSLASLGASTRHNTTLAAGTTRHEYVAASVQGSGEARAQVWRPRDKAWGNAVTLTTTGPGASHAFASVAYEDLGGDAVVVYGDNTATPKYRVWDGTAWSAAASVTVGTTGTVQHVRLVADRGTDRIVLLTGDANADLHAVVWTGSAWANGQTLTTNGGSNLLQPFDAAWEDGSGDLLVVYNDGTNAAKYRTWNGASWSAEASAPSNGGAGDHSDWIRLAARPGSDTVFLAMQDGAGDLQTVEWSGTAWGVNTRQQNGLAVSAVRNFDLAVEGSSGEALLVYGRSGQSLAQYRTYASSWSSAANVLDTNASSADLPHWVVLGADGRSDGAVLLTSDAGHRVGYQRWTGSGWANATELEWNSDRAGKHLAAAWRATAADLPYLDADGTYPWETAAFGSLDTTQTTTLVFNEGTPGLVYNRTGASASGTWGQWASTPGALGLGSGAGAQLAGRYLKARHPGITAAETFAFEACSESGEADLSHVRVASTHAAFNDTANGTDGNGHAITAAERAQTTKPTTGAGIDADGYAVWNPSSSGADCLAVQYRHTWSSPLSGTYTQKATARSSAGTWAEAPAANADTTTFDNTATATLDFTATRFTGVTDSAFLVALDGRIDVHWHVGTETDPSAVATWEGSSTNDADGAVAFTVGTPGHVAWVYYTVDLVTPGGLAVLRDQSYTAAFTWG